MVPRPFSHAGAALCGGKKESALVQFIWLSEKR